MNGRKQNRNYSVLVVIVGEMGVRGGTHPHAHPFRHYFLHEAEQIYKI